MHWENNRCAISLTTLKKIAETYDITKEKIYNLLKEGEIQTRKDINLFFKYKNIVKFLPFISVRGKNDLIIKQTGKQHIGKISKLFNIKVHHSSNKQLVIKNIDLRNFFSIFFYKILITKINPPLTNFVKNLNNIDLRKAIICPLL